MKLIYTFALALIFCFTTFAQTPQGINYQGVARNSSGTEVINQSIGIKFSVLNGSASGPAVYTETHSTTTDANGLFTLVIGGGTPSTGTFVAIDWSTGGGKWLQVSMDITGGSSYQLLGASQLLSVPYAQYAGKVANNGGKSVLILTDSITDAEAAAIIAAEVGPNTHEIKIVDCVNLTNVDLSSVTTATSIQILDNPSLTTINLNGLKRSFGGIRIAECPLLNAISFPALTKISADGLTIENTGIVSVAAPLLSSFQGDLFLSNNSNMTTASFPLLESCLQLKIQAAQVLTSVNFSSLTNCTKLQVTYCNALTSFSFPNLIGAGVIFIEYTALTSLSFPQVSSVVSIYIVNNALTSISMPSLSFFPSEINISFNQLPTSEVNDWLAKAAYSIQMNFGSITYFNSGGQTPPAPPSGTGISDANLLTSQGVLVITD